MTMFTIHINLKSILSKKTRPCVPGFLIPGYTITLNKTKDYLKRNLMYDE